jgi:hypothetical protein
MDQVVTLETPTVATLANRRFELREAKRALEAQIKVIDAELTINEVELIEAADTAGMTHFRVGKLSIAVSEQVVGNVDDWDQLYDYITTNSAFHLLQRRLGNAAYKEILDSGETVPGVAPFTKRSINLRASA